MPSKIKRVPWPLLGRKAGHASGWDQSDTFEFILYDFVPNEGVKLPSGTIGVNFERGVAETYDDEGAVVLSVDLIEALANAPRE